MSTDVEAVAQPPENPFVYERGLTFGHALILLQAGRRVRRAAWLHPGYYVYIDRRYPDRITYVCDRAALTDEDLLASDWEVL